MHLHRLALIALLALAAPAAPAAVSRLDLSTAPSTAAEPPSYPDADHVTNGCHVSTVTFLARFLAEFPAESGHPLVITIPNGDGVVRSHTVSIITWQGALWCRDEYFGVFTLGFDAKSQPDQRRLIHRTESRLNAQALTQIRTGHVAARPVPPSQLSTAVRLHDVTVAARSLPYATKVYWVRGGNRDIPVVFFRPAAGQIAVYDPLHGTCLAECAARDDAKIVSLVATQLGYRVDGVLPDLSPAPATLVAAVSAPAAGLAQ
jgi:hypothetical protein